jgi:iron complex outermembrane receptor protein
MSLEELMSISVDSVYGASGFEQKVTEAPASVTIITSEEIQRYGYRTLADILRNVPGFYITYDRNYSYVGVRGFGLPGQYNNNIALMIDVHRLNDNIYDGALVGTEFPLDLDLIQRVEVIRGPSRLLKKLSPPCDFLKFGFALKICAEMIVKSPRCFCMDRWRNACRRSIRCGR